MKKSQLFDIENIIFIFKKKQLKAFYIIFFSSIELPQIV